MDNAIKDNNIKKGANLYAFEYLKLHLNKYVKIKDVLEYYNKKTKEITGSPVGDPSIIVNLLSIINKNN